MKRYRTSGLRLSILVLLSILISALWATGSANFNVFLVVEAIFIAMAISAWSYTEVHFEKDEIVRTILFLFSTRSRISSVKRVRFRTDVDAFGGRTAYATIEFNDATRFVLFDFSKDDLREIANRISSIAPSAIDVAFRKHLDSEVGKDWKTAFRPGDGFLFAAGAFFLLLVLVVWLFQKLHIIL
jgi:hypothetical protein